MHTDPEAHLLVHNTLVSTIEKRLSIRLANANRDDEDSSE